MKIAHINATCTTGSTGRLVSELDCYARSLGYDSVIYYGSDQNPATESFRIGSRKDQLVHAVISRVTGKQGYASHFSTTQLVHNLRQYKPDIVHLHNMHSNYINLPILLSFLAENDIATVLTLHDCWFFTGKCVYPIRAKCTRFAAEGCHNCPQLHLDNVNPTLFFDRTKECFEDKKRLFSMIPRLGVVGVSNWVTRESEKSYLGTRNPICIYNWVDRSVFKPQSGSDIAFLRNSLGISPEEKMVLMVFSRMSERKGYQLLCELAPRFRDDTKLVIVGGNPDSLKTPDGVIFVGATKSREKLALFYSAADVCLNATKCETFGLVTAESICCGTPVIVNNNTASPELLGPSDGFVLLEEDSVEEILAFIDEVPPLTEGKKATYCLDRGSKFDAKTLMNSYLDYYGQLIRGECGFMAD